MLIFGAFVFIVLLALFGNYCYAKRIADSCANRLDAFDYLKSNFVSSRLLGKIVEALVLLVASVVLLAVPLEVVKGLYLWQWILFALADLVLVVFCVFATMHISVWLADVYCRRAKSKGL